MNNNISYLKFVKSKDTYVTAIYLEGKLVGYTEEDIKEVEKIISKKYKLKREKFGDIC
jgi:hypothetical protein